MLVEEETEAKDCQEPSLPADNSHADASNKEEALIN